MRMVMLVCATATEIRNVVIYRHKQIKEGSQYVPICIRWPLWGGRIHSMRHQLKGQIGMKSFLIWTRATGLSRRVTFREDILVQSWLDRCIYRVIGPAPVVVSRSR